METNFKEININNIQNHKHEIEELLKNTTSPNQKNQKNNHIPNYTEEYANKETQKFFNGKKKSAKKINFLNIFHAIFTILSFSIFFFEENLANNLAKIIIFATFTLIIIIISLIEIFKKNFEYLKILKFIKSILTLTFFLIILLINTQKNQIFIQAFFYLEINLEIFMQKEITILYLICTGITYSVSIISIYEIKFFYLYFPLFLFSSFIICYGKKIQSKNDQENFSLIFLLLEKIKQNSYRNFEDKNLNNLMKLTINKTEIKGNLGLRDYVKYSIDKNNNIIDENFKKENENNLEVKINRNKNDDNKKKTNKKTSKSSFFNFDKSKKKEDSMKKYNDNSNNIDDNKDELELELENFEMKDFIKNLKTQNLNNKFMKFNGNNLSEIVEKMQIKNHKFNNNDNDNNNNKDEIPEEKKESFANEIKPQFKYINNKKIALNFNNNNNLIDISTNENRTLMNSRSNFVKKNNPILGEQKPAQFESANNNNNNTKNSLEKEKEENSQKNKISKKLKFLGEFLWTKNNKIFHFFLKNNDPYSNSEIELIFYDMSYLKKFESNFIKNNNSQNTDINKQLKFFAKIAHEFKTPITSIIGLLSEISNIEDSENEEKEKKQIKNTIIQAENLSNYMLYLINDMIEYSNLNDEKNNLNQNENENNLTKVNLDIQEIKLEEICSFCTDITKTLILSKGKENKITINNIYNKEINKLILKSDEFRLKQILLNFISNSVKFTKTGYINIISEIIVKNQEQEKEDKIVNLENLGINNSAKNLKNFKIKVTIADTGMGIKEKDLEMLLKFQDNTMLGSANGMNASGTGLGLSIIKFLADRLKHEIKINSEYGKGSEFSLLLNLEENSLSPRLLISRESEISPYLMNLLKFSNTKKLSLKSSPSLSSELSQNSVNKLIQDLLIIKNLEKYKERSDSFKNKDNSPIRSSSSFHINSDINENNNNNNRVRINTKFSEEEDFCPISLKDNETNLNNFEFAIPLGDNDNEDDKDKNKKKFKTVVNLDGKLKDVLRRSENLNLNEEGEAEIQEEDFNQNNEGNNNTISEESEYEQGKSSELYKVISDDKMSIINSNSNKSFNLYNDHSNGIDLEEVIKREKRGNEISEELNKYVVNEERYEENSTITEKIDDLKFSINSNNSNWRRFINDEIVNENNNSNNRNNNNSTNVKKAEEKIIKEIKEFEYKEKEKDIMPQIDNDDISNKEIIEKKEISKKNKKKETKITKSNTFDYSSIKKNPNKNKTQKTEGKFSRKLSSNIIHLIEESEGSENEELFNQISQGIEYILTNNRDIKNKNLEERKNLIENYLKANNKFLTLSDKSIVSVSRKTIKKDSNNLLLKRKLTSESFLLDENNNNNNNNADNKSVKEIKDIILKNNLSIKEKDLEGFNSFKYKILVVDDNKILRTSFITIIQRFLKIRNLSSFYEVIECIDGVDILYHIVKDQNEDHLIKCVITDESMDYMNGSEACRILKSFENDNKIKPVVVAMISSFSSNYFDKNFGINYFLPKPCKIENLATFFENFKLFYNQD